MPAKVNLSPDVGTQRPLGAIEEFHYLLKQFVSPTIVLAVDVEGKVDPERWHTAVEAVSQRHPLLRSIVIRQPPRRPIFQVVSETARQAARVLPLENADLDTFYRDELQTSFALTDAPWRPTLFLGEARAVLAISIDHTISDGRGAAFLVQELLDVLSGATLDGKMPLPLSHDQLLGLKPSDLYLKERASIFRQQPEGTPPSSETAAGLVIEHESIDDTMLQKIAAAARINGTTIHGALTAALIFTGAKLHDPWAAKPIGYISPIDNRPFLDNAGQFGVFLTYQGGDFVSSSSDFWTLARRVRQEIVSALTPAHSAEVVRSMQGAMASEMLPEDTLQFFKPWDLMVTNYGALPIASDYGSLRITAIRPHITSIPQSQTVSAATIGGRLSLSNVSLAPIPNLLAETKTFLADL